MRRGFALRVLAVCALVLSALPPRASAGRSVAEAVPSLPAKVKKSRSLGLPWRGKLERGVKLAPSTRVRYVTEYASTAHFYGAWQLVQLLERAAHRVDVRLPGARLSVGEISGREGGDLPGHASHESGRDVDLGFYMRDAVGRPYDAFAYARFDERGRGLAPNVGLSLDVPRNWELLARLVTDGEARVQFVFVSPGIRQLLLAEGRRRGASAAVLERAARVMVKPSEKHPHGNHFHVRIYCAPADRPRCEDRPPYWPWYPGAPPDVALAPLP
jgi:penicillin-insensitive murein endopeptidase